MEDRWSATERPKHGRISVYWFGNLNWPADAYEVGEGGSQFGDDRLKPGDWIIFDPEKEQTVIAVFPNSQFQAYFRTKDPVEQKKHLMEFLKAVQGRMVERGAGG